MHQFSSIIPFTSIILLNCYEYVQSIVNDNRDFRHNNFTPEINSISSANNNYSYWLFHNKTRVNLFQENLINYNQQNQLRNYENNMLMHAQFERTNNQRVEAKIDMPLLERQFIGQRQELSRRNTYNMFDPHRQKENTINQISMSSNEHLKKRHLAEYNNVPSLSSTILEMPPNLHHPHLPLITYKTTATKSMSHATSNEPSPLVATESNIKTVATIKAHSDEKFIANNKFNYYNNNALPAPRSASKQFLYSPLRSSWEKELPTGTNVLPYPPSFIYITTTEKPILLNNYKNTVEDTNKMPDFFIHRQFKSLWDSYIPSWHTMKYMQQFRAKMNKNNFQTLAFTKDGKMKIEK